MQVLTANTACFQPVHLWFGVDALGIMAPLALQRTTFKKDGRTNAGAVLGREPLQMQDQRLFYFGLFVYNRRSS